MGFKAIIGSAVRLALVGACGYATHDAVNDAVMYLRAKDWLEKGLENHPDVLEHLGSDPEMGPWHDASVTFTHQGMVASVNVPVRGAAKGCDAMIRAIRREGFRSPLLFNLTGGQWDIMAMDVLLGMHSNRMISVSLLDKPSEQQDAEERARRAKAMGSDSQGQEARGA